MNSLHWLDHSVVILYLLCAVGLGLLFRKQDSREEFFAASRSMGWFTVGLSVMATLFSANSFVFYPSASYGSSLRMALAILAFTAMAPLVIWVFIPVYARLNCQTAYHYLEQRFHVSVRCMASGLFVLLRIGWMASATFAASVAIAGISGVDRSVVIVSLGVGAILYTMLGGLRAVMWTDVLQFFVFSLSILLALYLLAKQCNGGFSGMVETYFAGRENMIIDLSPSMTLKYGTWAVVMGSFLEGLSAFGADQVAVQRYLAARDEKTSQIGFGVNLGGLWIVFIGLMLIGVGLYSYFHERPQDLAPVVVQHIEKKLTKTADEDESLAIARFRTAEPVNTAAIAKYYQQHPEQVALDMRGLNLQDQALSQFVRLRMPPGVVGLLLAALMAATMSSIDSGIHSVTTALVVDFRDRLFPRWRPKTPAGETQFARMMILVIGVFSVGLALFVEPLGDVFAVSKKLTSAFGGPLLAVFILAFFIRQATSLGVFIGALLGAVLTMFLIYQYDNWFSLWFWPIGFLTATVIALLVSFAPFVGYYSKQQETPLTFWEVMRRSK